MPEEQDIQTDEFGIPIKKKAQVNNTSVDEFGIPIKKKDSGTTLKNGGLVPVSTTASQSIKSNSVLPSFLQRGSDIATGQIFNNVGQQQATTTGNIILNNGKSALDADLDFTFNNSLDAPDSKSPLSLSNISSLDSDPSLLDMPKEQQIEAKKRAIKNDPDLLRDYRIKRTAEIKTIKQGAEVNKSQNISFLPMSDNQTGVVIDPAAVSQSESVISAADQYETHLQESIKSAAKIAVPKSFIDKNEPLDSKKVGQKYLETIGDPTVRDEVNVIDGLQNTDVVVMGLTVQGEAKYSGTDIEKTQQGIQYKFDKSGSAVISDYFLDQAKQIATAEPDKISAYVTAKQRRADSKDKIEQSQLDGQLSMMLQDESVRSFQGALGQSENYATRYENAADQYPQVKRAKLRQQYNDAYMSIIAGQDEVDAVTGMGAKVLLRGLFGSTPNKSEIQKIATMTGQPVEEVQAEIDNGGFFKDTPYTVRINGFLQGIAGGAKETIAESQMGMRRLLNFDNAATDNAVTQTNIDEYTLQAQANKMRDESGKWNVNPYTIFNTMGHGLGQSAIFAGPTLGAGAIAVEGTVAAHLTEAATTVASGYAGSYEGAYKEAAKYTADEDLRREYANYTAFENAIPELLLSPADIIKKMSPGRPGTKGAFQAFAKEASEKGLEETVAQKMAAFGKQLGNVVLAENVEEAATNVTNNLTKERLFGVQTSASDWLNQAFETAVTTTITTIPLGIGAGIGGVNDVSGVRKEGYFEAGNEPELYTVKLQDRFAKGLLSQEQLDQKIQVVNTMAGIVAGVNKMTKADGSPLSYSEKADVAAQQFRINNNNSILKGNPIDGVKPIIEADNNEALNIQNNILSSNTNQNEKSSEQAQGQDVNAEKGQRGTVQPEPVPGEKEKVLSQPGVNEPVSSEAPNQEDVITIQDVMDKPVTYNGQRARVYQDGQAVVIKIDGENKEYEIGNIDELNTRDIADFGIEHEESVVSFDDAGDIVVRGKTYQNKYSDPLAAINRDEDGNVVSVNLDLPDGTKRTFRGNVAEDLAYNISLKEITKDNETRQQFEDFLNTDEISVELGSVPEITAQEATSDNTEVQREKVESVSSKTEETPPTVKSEIRGPIKTRNGNIIKVDEERTKLVGEEGYVSYKIESKSGEDLGEIHLGKINDGYDVDSVDISPKRQGIGKDVYISLIENLDKPLLSGKTLTPEAKYLWESLKKNGYATFNEKEGRYISKNIPALIETKKFTNSGSDWTHLTNSDEAIESLIKTGKFIGKGEKLENFVKEVSDKRFNLSHENASSPYFQKGKFYGEPGQKWLIVAKGDEKFTPNINHGNAKSFEYSKGVGVLNPENRSIENFEIYKRGEDGEYYKYDFKNETTQDAKQTELVKIGTDEKQADEVPVTTESSRTGTEAPNENQRGSGKKPPTTGENTAEDGEEDAPVGITHAGLAKMREELGLPPYDKTKVTDNEIRALADLAIENGYKINRLLDRMDEGHKPNPIEVVILAKYKPIIHAEAKANPTDENIKLAQRFANTIQKTTSDVGRGFRLLREIPQDAKESVVDIMVDMMGDYQVDSLTDEQKAEAQDRFAKIEAALEKEAKLRIEAEQEIDRLKAEAAIAQAKKDNTKNTPAKRKKTEDDYRQERTKIIDDIKDKWKNAGKGIISIDFPLRKQFSAIAPDVARLIGSYVEQGIATTLEEVRKALKKDIEDAGINISDDDVRALIAGNYNEKRPDRSELSKEVGNLRKEEALLLELDALENGEVPVSNKAKIERNQKLKDIREKIEKFKKENEIGRYSPESRFEGALKQRIKSNKDAQNALLDRIKKGNYAEDAVDESILENKLLQSKNKKLYEEYLQSIIDKDKALLEYEKSRLKDQMEGMSVLEKIGDYTDIVLTTSKGAVAMFDQSAVLVQMLLATGAHPIETLKNLPTALRDLIDNKWFDRRMAKLKTSKVWDIVKDSGLAIMDPEGMGENVRNELLGGRKNILNRNVGIRWKGNAYDLKIKGKTFSPGKAFERSTAALFNNIRMYLFLNKVQDLYKAQKTYESHPEEFKAAARVINEFTGHGKLPQWVSSGAPVINNVIWSPKMMASTFNVLGLGDVIRPMETVKEIRKAFPKYLKGSSVKENEDNIKGFYSSLTPSQRKFARTEMLRFVSTASVLMLTAHLIGVLSGGDDKDRFKVDLDPLSPGFGSIMKGDKSVNILGRFGVPVRVLSQLIMGKRKINGKVDILGDKFGDKNGFDVFYGSFGRGKMTPFAGQVHDYFLNGQKNYFTKEQMTAGGIAKSLVVPISLQEAGTDFKRDGELQALFETIFKSYGGNIRDKSDFKKKK